MNALYMLVAATLFGVCVTLAAEWLLAKLCSSFFDRVRWCFDSGLYSAGLYEYSSDFAATDEERAALAAAWTKPLLTVSAICACLLVLICTGGSSFFGGLLWALIGSLVPTVFMLLTVFVGFLLIVLDEEFDIRLYDTNPDFEPGYASLYTTENTLEHINRARLVRSGLLSMEDFTARLPGNSKNA